MQLLAVIYTITVFIWILYFSNTIYEAYKNEKAAQPKRHEDQQ